MVKMYARSATLATRKIVFAHKPINILVGQRLFALFVLVLLGKIAIVFEKFFAMNLDLVWFLFLFFRLLIRSLHNLMSVLHAKLFYLLLT